MFMNIHQRSSLDELHLTGGPGPPPVGRGSETQLQVGGNLKQITEREKVNGRS